MAIPRMSDVGGDAGRSTHNPAQLSCIVLVLLQAPEYVIIGELSRSVDERLVHSVPMLMRTVRKGVLGGDVDMGRVYRTLEDAANTAVLNTKRELARLRWHNLDTGIVSI